MVEFGVAAMKYFCPFYFLLGILHGLAGTVRGTGKSVPPMVVLLALPLPVPGGLDPVYSAVLPQH